MASSRSLTDAVDLSPTQPFDFEQSLRFVRGFAPCADSHRTAGAALTTGGYAGGTPFVADLRARDGGRTLRATITWPDGRGDVEAVVDHLHGYLSLDDDLGGFYRQASDDPPFAGVVESLRGYHHVRFPTPFEAACWAAISQRTPWQVARSLKRSLVTVAGDKVEHGGATIPLFPTPARVLAHEDAVTEALSHDRKRRTVLAAAAAFEGSSLADLSGDRLRDRLADVWGFGDWSSEFIALRGFGRMDRLPTTEDRLREVVASVYDLDGDRAEDGTLARLGDRYAPQEGYWAHYLRVYAHRGGENSGD